METIQRQMEDKQMTGNSQRGFTKVKLHPTNLNVLYDEMTGSVEQWIAVSIIYPVS